MAVGVTSEQMPGALVSGWSAFVVDVLLSRNLDRYLAAMTPDQRAEVAATRAAVHGAAKLWQERAASGTGSGPVEIAAAVSELSLSVTVAEAALALGSSGRRVRKLAERWQRDGLARKVGTSWVIDRDALEMHAARRRRGAA